MLSPDGRYICYVERTAFALEQSETHLKWRISFMLFRRIPGFLPMPSPDGKSVYFAHFNEDQFSMSLWSVPSDGGKAIKIFELPQGYDGFFRLRPNSREISFLVRKDGVANIWTQSLDGEPAKMYTNFSEDNIAFFEWMPDGKSLVVSHGNSTADVVLITQEK
jgi:Tol biopolymer transport system component